MAYATLLLDIISRAKSRFTPDLLLAPYLEKLPVNKPIHILAVGKAAFQMAAAVQKYAAENPLLVLGKGLVITRYDYPEGTLPGISVLQAGHPMPDHNSILAAKTALAFVKHLPANDILLILLSGGGSALLEMPEAGITLDELIRKTKDMLHSGVDIEYINSQRKKMSALKGGKLWKLINPAEVRILAMSDVPGDKIGTLASNPFVPEQLLAGDESRLNLSFDDLPDKSGSTFPSVQQDSSCCSSAQPDQAGSTFPSVQQDLSCCSSAQPDQAGSTYSHILTYDIIANNADFCAALAKSAQELLPDLPADRIQVISTSLTGEAAKAGAEIGRLAAFILQQQSRGLSTFRIPCLLIFGGETSVTVQGGGIGGRCSELALSAAQSIAGFQNISLLAYATDGSDGISSSSGALVDGNTKELLAEHNISLSAYLDNNDSYTALAAISATLPAGPTGINVNDVVLLHIR